MEEKGSRGGRTFTKMLKEMRAAAAPLEKGSDITPEPLEKGPFVDTKTEPLEKGTAAAASTAPPLEKGSDITPEPLEKGAGTASGKAASGKGNSSFWL